MNLDFQQIQIELQQGLPQKINDLGEILFTESWKVAKALTPLVMAAEMTFIGFRVMFNAAISEQLTSFTRKFFICYLLVYTNLVTGLFVGNESILEGLKTAGSTLGSQITRLAPQSSSAVLSPDPIIYWGNWIQDGGPGEDKFDFRYQHQILFKSDPNIPKGFGRNSTNSTSTPSSSAKDKGPIHAEDYFYLITLPMIAIGNVIATAGMQISATLAPLFTSVGILYGSELALRMILSLGICVIPLIFFHQFERIFIHYLHALVGIALIAPLFYILSAIGFVLATQTYQIIVVNHHLAYTLYSLFAQVADQTIDQMIHFTAGGTDYGSIKETLKNMLHYFGAYLCGSLVIATFVIGGVTLAASSVSLALRWNQAFADEGLIRAFAGFFNRIEGSFTQGLSQGMNSGMQGMNSLFGSQKTNSGK